MKARVLGPLLFVGALAACGGANQPARSRVMVATLLGTPDVTLSGEALAGGGTGYTVPGRAEAFVFLGGRERETLDARRRGSPAPR